MRTITCLGDRTSGTSLIIASVSQAENFVNVNVFNSVESSRVLSYRKSQLCKYEYIAALTSNAGHVG